jgi:hypothetical protein
MENSLESEGLCSGTILLPVKQETKFVKKSVNRLYHNEIKAMHGNTALTNSYKSYQIQYPNI